MGYLHGRRENEKLKSKKKEGEGEGEEREETEGSSGLETSFHQPFVRACRQDRQGVYVSLLTENCYDE